MLTFTDLLQELGIQFKRAGESHHVSTGWVGLPCPFCGSRDWHLGYNLAGGYMTCWRCGPHDAVHTLCQLSERPYNDVRRLLENIHGAVVRDEVTVRGTFKAPANTSPLKSVMHRLYLKKRGLNPTEVACLWGVQEIGLDHRLPWRLYIPVHHRGRPVSWTTRSVLSHSRQPYIGARADEESVSRKDLLYGEDYARHAIVVVEGPVDVWAIGPGAVSTMGAAYTRAQLGRMAKYPVRVICGDTDETGATFAARLAKELAPFPGVTHVVKLETGKDPADCDKDEIRELRKRFLEC